MKRPLVLWATVIAVILATVGVTVALLIASSNSVINTFTVGQIQLTLTESSGANYPLIPGTSQTKDPVLTVKAGSEACWLFFKAEKTPEFDNYITFSPATGWEPLPGYSDVYYRSVGKTGTDVPFPLLQGNQVHIKETLTEQLMAALSEPPKVTFIGYAAQQDGVADARTAWQQILKEGGQTHE